MSRRRRSIPRPLIYLILIVVIIGGAYVAFGDDITDAINVVLYGDQSQPQIAQTPAPAPAKPAAEAAATPAPAASAPLSGTTAAVPAPAQPAAQAAATPAVPAPAATTSAPAEAAAPGAATAPTPVAAPAPAAVAQSAQPVAIASAATPAQPAASVKTAAVTPDQNLPAVLDRIRQQRTGSSLQPRAVVDRAPTAASSSDTANQSAAAGMVSVTQESATERDDAEQAYDLLLHGRYEGALDLYDNALKANPDSLPALLGKAIALHKLRRLSEARPLYQRVLTLDPNNREALTNMTAIAAAQAPTTALHELRELQKTNPTFSPISAQIASIEAQGGNVAGAMVEFSRAIQLSPDNGLYRLNLAVLQDRAGMAAEAAASYQAALDRLSTDTQLPIPIDSIRARLRYLRSR
jgi:Tfp pilus assembly protein PilF